MWLGKNRINKSLTVFLFAHVIIWTLVPSISNNNLPLDTIEALAWSSNLDWGFNKHPPLSAFVVKIFYQIFANQDWVYYLLSQLFVVLAFLSIIHVTLLLGTCFLRSSFATNIKSDVAAFSKRKSPSFALR